MKGGGNMEISLSVRQAGPRVTLTAEGPDDGQGLYKAYLTGPRGRVLLGTMMPEGETLRVRRTFSVDELRRQGAWPIGEARAELYYAFRVREAAPPPGWSWADRAGDFFQETSISQAVTRLGRVLCRWEGEKFTLAYPYQNDKEFPLPQLFCFSRLKRLGEELFLLFSFENGGWPVVQKE